MSSSPVRGKEQLEKEKSELGAWENYAVEKRSLKNPDYDFVHMKETHAMTASICSLVKSLWSPCKSLNAPVGGYT